MIPPPLLTKIQPHAPSLGPPYSPTGSMSLLPPSCSPNLPYAVRVDVLLLEPMSSPTLFIPPLPIYPVFPSSPHFREPAVCVPDPLTTF